MTNNPEPVYDRELARSLGLKRYLGQPCPNPEHWVEGPERKFYNQNIANSHHPLGYGLIISNKYSERNVSINPCRQCKSVQAKKNRNGNSRKKNLARMKRWYHNNKEHIEKYREENKEEIIAKRKAYREENKEEIRARKKEYNEENKEEIRAKRKARRNRAIQMIGGVCAHPDCNINNPDWQDIDHKEGYDGKRKSGYKVISDILNGNIEPYQPLCTNHHLVKTYNNGDYNACGHNIKHGQHIGKSRAKWKRIKETAIANLGNKCIYHAANQHLSGFPQGPGIFGEDLDVDMAQLDHPEGNGNKERIDNNETSGQNARRRWREARDGVNLHDKALTCGLCHKIKTYANGDHLPSIDKD